MADADLVVSTGWMREFAARDRRKRPILTDLDAAIGDADHGINMDRGMTRGGGRAWTQAPPSDIAARCANRSG